jgi:hypothetical protein
MPVDRRIWLTYKREGQAPQRAAHAPRTSSLCGHFRLAISLCMLATLCLLL